MKLRIVFFAIVFCGLVTSCVFDNCKKVYLTKDETEWFLSFQKGDTILYKSNEGDIDTMVIEGKYHYLSNCNKIEKSSYQHDQYFLRVDKVGKNRMKYAVGIEFSKELQHNSKAPCSKYFSIYNIQTKDLAEIEKRSPVSLYDSISKMHVDTYFVEVDSNTNSYDNDPQIKSFNWSKEHGLIRYVKVSGEIYQLYKRW